MSKTYSYSNEEMIRGKYFIECSEIDAKKNKGNYVWQTTILSLPSELIIYYIHIVVSHLYFIHHQWLYRPLLSFGLFFSSVIFFTQTVGLLGRVISPSQGRYLHKHRHQCLEWDSNPRFQHSSEKRQFVS
jgi:hypothetical protein